MSDFLNALASDRVLLMDGAMGTELQRAGIQPDECYEQWNLTRPDTVEGIHRSYVDAGAECLLTNTFQANPPQLKKHGLDSSLNTILLKAVALARKAAGDRFVIADVGPFGPEGGGWCNDWWRRMLPSLSNADAVLLETFSSMAVFDLVGCIRQSDLRPSGMPILVSLTYRKDSGWKTFDGSSPEDLAKKAEDYGVAALGANCGVDMDMQAFADVIHRYRRASELPLFARPNAGTPTRDDNRWIYPHAPSDMANKLRMLLEAGASMVGGCCGTAPRHIAAFKCVVDDWNQC